ncbi:MAG TPA: choice-of-anchor D domain-containing protein [Terriglobia bacterium]|nr:choice-of-anchor D domain-containing protein [Terriglobia bacterium]
MKRLPYATCLFAVVIATFQPLSAQIQGQWTSTGAMQSPREFNAQVLLAGGKVLSLGGVNNSGTILASAEVYTPSTGTWKLTGSMAEAREAFPAVELASGKVLVSGGYGAGGAVLAAAELYDPSTGTWSSAGSMSVGRFGHTATLLLTGKVLVTGGCTSSTCSTYTAESELYDPTSNSWSKTGTLKTARYYQTAVRLKTGRVLAIGGSPSTTSCELYDPSSGAWSVAASTNTARSANTSTLLPNGKVLAAGGAAGRYPISSAELYDPTANTWTLTGSMKMGRYGHTATLLTDSTVLIAGGEGQSISCGKACTSYIPTAQAELYNQTTGSFTATTSLSHARAYHATTLLAGGKALADGGSGYTSTCCIVLGSAEYYTPLTLTFSATSLNFGLLQIGLTSAPQTVTVTNVSSHSATFTSITSSGDFSQTHTCPTTLNAGQNCTITVTFKPTAAGARNGSVTLNDNCPGSPTQTIALSGTGELGALSLTPTSLTFPATLPGYSSSPMTATLHNDSAGPVTITAIAISSSGTFAQTNNCSSSLTAGQTCKIQVTFTPPDSGSYTGSLSVSFIGKGSPATVSLSGSGID